MNYKIQLSGDITVLIDVKKTFLGNHPKVSSYLYYRSTTLSAPVPLHSTENNIKYGLKYDQYNDYHAFLEAMILLGSCFKMHRFVFDEFPYLKEYDCGAVSRHYKDSTFPLGSTFMIKDLIIDINAEVYYLLTNSIEGTVVATHEQLSRYPEIMNNFRRTISSDEVGIGFLSNNIIGKKFKVIKSSGNSRQCQLDIL
ncbi:MAG: hypothetical protein IKK89_06770 [Alistipes sp.]|jgi:hypothetical protein|nr:hypothetical protein [Alistipes sp.]